MPRSFVRSRYRFAVAVPFAAVLSLAAFFILVQDASAQTIGFSSPTASVTEGNAGTVNLNFPIQFSSPPANGQFFSYSLTAGTATAGTDYVDSSGAVVGFFCIGTCPTTSTVSIQVNGDTDVEPNETFTITLTSGDFAIDPTKSSATGTIVDNDALTPNLTVNDVSLNEGNAGTTTFTFTVSLSAPAGPGGVTFDIATADGTAQDDNPASEDNDYVAKSLTGQTIPAGSSTYTFDVLVNGDMAVEPNETFVVNVTNVIGATPTDGQGQGTIQNDDSVTPQPSLSIADVTQTEGNSAPTRFTFTVSLSAPAGSGGVSFDIATADNTATVANADYAAKVLSSQSIPAGSSSYTLSVTVNGDTAVEPNETFFVNVTNAIGATVVDGQALGTISNDDATGPVPPSPPTTSPGTVVNTAGDDDTDDPPKETDEQRQQRQHTNRSNKDDVYTEGNVIAVRLTLADPIPVLERGFIAEPDAVPYVLIGNKDGVQQIALQGDAVKAGTSIRVGDYVEVDGTKESEVLFRADEIDVTHTR